MTPRFVGAVPDDEWGVVLRHYLALSDAFLVHVPEGEGPLGNGGTEFRALPGVTVRAWSGMRDAVEIAGPMTRGAQDAFLAHETSLVLLDPGRKLWDYQLLRRGSVLLPIGDFTDLLVGAPEPDVLRHRPRTG